MEKYAWISNRIVEMEWKATNYIIDMMFDPDSYWDEVGMHDCYFYSLSERILNLTQDGGSAIGPKE